MTAAAPAAAVVLSALCALPPAYAPDQGPAIGPAIVEEINRARTDPAVWAALLEQQLPFYVGHELRRPGQITVIMSEGAPAVREAIQALRAQAPLPPLAWSPELARAAADHVRNQGPTGQLGHTGTDGSTLQDRLDRYGGWMGAASENIDYGHSVAREVVMALLIDDGVPSRGHRRNILDARIRLAGAACGPHQRFGAMCVVDHVTEYTPNP